MSEDEVITLTVSVITILLLPVTPTVAFQQSNAKSNIADTFLVDSADPQAVEYEKLLANYEVLGRKLAEFNSTQPAQHGYESPQQFLFRMIGLKQKVMFASRQDNMDIEYEPRIF